MPFTLSHAALVLPATFLPKKTYSLTGLVIGSFVPDFEYFIRMKDLSLYSHTWLGLLWFDIPLGLLIAFLYHYVVRDALLENLPKGLYQRLSQFKKFNWLEYFKVNWLVVIISIAIGTASHIFWDSFTHWDGYFVRVIPILREYTIIFGIPVPYYNVLQHLSTLVGGVIIFFAIYKMPKDTLSKQNAKVSYWIVAIMIGILLLIVRVFLGFNYKSFDQSIINVISCGLMSIILVPILFRTKYI